MVKSTVFTIFILMVIVMVTGCASSLTPDKESQMKNDVTFDEIKVMVFQLPNCECCGRYQGYLRAQGFQVETTYVEDMPSLHSIKRRFQIPRSVESCHTAVIGDYFVEGHVPVAAVAKLLAEKPDIDGIALPSMPSGSPGMPGQQTEAFQIYALSSGKTSEFMVISH